MNIQRSFPGPDPVIYKPFNPKKGDSCSICNESLKRIKRPVLAHENKEGHEGTKHPVHKKCIEIWLKRNPACPICRIPIQQKEKKLTIARDYVTRKDYVMMSLFLTGISTFSGYLSLSDRRQLCDREDSSVILLGCARGAFMALPLGVIFFKDHPPFIKKGAMTDLGVAKFIAMGSPAWITTPIMALAHERLFC